MYMKISTYMYVYDRSVIQSNRDLDVDISTNGIDRYRKPKYFTLERFSFSKYQYHCISIFLFIDKYRYVLDLDRIDKTIGMYVSTDR